MVHGSSRCAGLSFRQCRDGEDGTRGIFGCAFVGLHPIDPVLARMPQVCAVGQIEVGFRTDLTQVKDMNDNPRINVV